MNIEIIKEIKKMTPKEQKKIFENVFKIKEGKNIYHIKNNKIFIYDKPKKLRIIIFNNESKKDKTIKEIKIKNINIKKMYEKYIRKEELNNIELFGTYLYTKNKKIKKDILKKIS